MSKKKDSHKSRLEAAFGVSDAPKEDLFDREDREQFGSTFNNKKKPKDAQYDRLMNEFKPRKTENAMEFEENGRYAGKKVGITEVFEENNEEFKENNENYDDIEVKEEKKEKKPIKAKKPLKNKKKVVKKPRKEKIDDFLEEIEEEDQQEEAQQAENSANSLEKAKTAKYQLNLWKILLSFRLQMQPVLDSLKKYPRNPSKTPLNSGNQLILSFLIENLSKIQRSLLKSSSCDIEEVKKIPDVYSIISQQITTSDPFLIDSESIYSEIDGLYSSFFPWAERNLAKWSEKTQILSSNLSKTGLKNLLHTPIGQVNKMMENFEKLQQKSQLKRGTFRVLFEGLENLEKDYDENIFDDSDLLQELIRGSLDQVREPSAGGTEENTLFDTTRQYLFERKLKNEEKKNKNVDRRASKNRKLRYDIHAKLINFMQSDERGLGEGREEIVRAIKRRFQKGDEEGIEPEIRKKVKENKDEPRLI